MANASGINDYEFLKIYADQLQNAAEDLSAIINDIQDRIDNIADIWNDKDREILNTLIEEKAPIVYNLSSQLWNYGIYVRQYAIENEAVGYDFHNTVRNS